MYRTYIRMDIVMIVMPKNNWVVGLYPNKKMERIIVKAIDTATEYIFTMLSAYL